MSDSVRDLLVRGIASARAGELKEARRYLEWVLRLNPTMDQQIQALFWLSEVSEDPVEKRDYLEEVLARQPGHHAARRNLAVLDGRIDPADIIDPNQLETYLDQDRETVVARRYECPQCGGRLTFTPDGQRLVCERCSRSGAFDGEGFVESDRPAFQDFTLALATAKGHARPISTRALACQACGASFMVVPQMISLTCPYCATVYVLDLADSRETIPPHGVIPFAFDLEDARKHLLAWRLSEQPGAWKEEPLRGIYLPVWVFNIAGVISWSYSEQYRSEWVRRTDQNPVLYDRNLVPAIEDLPQVWKRELSGVDLKSLAPYDGSYLADWPAEIYQVSLAEASLEAREQVVRIERFKILRGLRNQVKDFRLSSAGLFVDSFKLILAPVWISLLVNRGEKVPVMVNGLTGRVVPAGPVHSGEKWGSRFFGKIGL